ncbi:MAG: hypothetical protein M1817_003614 [Caeruleum heppii]|nr:MAG: hypothetical protein M1817_003614 [Caeruleum heppii]
MTALAPQMHQTALPSRTNPTVNGAGGNGPPSSRPNPQHDPFQHDAHPPAPAPPLPPNTNGSKKAKTKKVDPSETSKLLAAKISQLESDKAGEKDQEAEIEREVKKANRDLSNLLSNIESPLSRLDTVQKKYTELLADMRRLDRDHAKNKKRADQLQKEKDHGRSELSKTVSMKEKLEKLCRELQRENKKLKEEHKKLEESEKNSREHLYDQFDDILWEVQDVVAQKEDPGTQKLNMETEELFRQKFKSFIDQYELREIQFHSTLRAKELEVQYNMTRLDQQRKGASQETARSRALSAQVSTFSQTETELRSQLNIYVEKFKQVEDTLNNSNDLFLTFRKEMEEMSKKTKRLEKENLNLTRKHDLTNRNILEMAEERTRANKDLDQLRRKNANLESLCRGMQAQGRGNPNAVVAGGVGAGDLMGGVGEGEDEGTESDYEYDDEEDDDDEDGSEEVEYDDETEEEVLQRATEAGVPRTYGPVPPPPPPQQQGAVGVRGKVNGEVNGTKH